MTDYAHVIGFYGLALVTVGAALLVVSLRNIFHVVLFLVVSFVGVAGLYLTLNADMLAGIQVLVYAGAIAVLTLFAVFLTRNAMTQGNLPNHLQLLAFLTSGVLFVVLAFVFLNTTWAPGPAVPPAFPPERIAQQLFVNFVFPFEVASVLLLVAMVGAIALAKD